MRIIHSSASPGPGHLGSLGKQDENNMQAAMMSLGVRKNSEALAQMNALDNAHMVRRSEPHLLAAISSPQGPFWFLKEEKKSPQDFGITVL